MAPPAPQGTTGPEQQHRRQTNTDQIHQKYGLLQIKESNKSAFICNFAVHPVLVTNLRNY